MKRIRQVILFPMLALLVAYAAVAAAAELEVQVDRTRVLEGETVIMTVTSPGDSWGIPELGPLADDFDVQNQGQSTSTTIINGRVSTSREWRFLLAPKRSGRLTIPALKIGDHESSPIQLEVLPASQASQMGETLPVMVEADVDRGAPYVQGQVIYTARVLIRVNLQQATLDDPSAEGVIIERLGEDRSYETRRDGQPYKVIERRYALFPQHSGTVEIAPPVLSGGIPEKRQRSGGSGSPGSAFERFFGRDPFEDMGSIFQSARPIKVRGPELTLDVQPQPDGSSSPWLPAESLQLADTWTPDLSKLRVGEPVTRTIAITAQGLSAAQLPDLLTEVPDGVNLYPDKPRTETRADGDTLVAVKEIKQALVPSTEGELTLPEVRLAWWDTREDRERVAVLPARVVQVLPARSGTATGSAAPAPANAGLVDRIPADTDRAGEADVLPPSALIPESDVQGAEGPGVIEALLRGFPPDAGYWPWLGAGLGLLSLLTLLLWLRERAHRHRKRSVERSRRDEMPAPSLSSARSLVRRACDANDPRAARDALLDWARACWPTDPPTRLDSLVTRFTGPAVEILRALDRSLYSPDTGTWNGKAAWEHLRPALAGAESGRKRKAEGDGPLPPLYPQRA